MDPETREQMVMDNIRLVHYTAKKIYIPPTAYFSYEDVVQEGMIGLIIAVDKFDPNKGFAFSTYASSMIFGYMQKFLRDNSRVVKYSRSDIDAITKLYRINKDITEITPEDLESAGIPESKLPMLLSLGTIDLDVTIEGKDGSSSSLHEVIPDRSYSELSSDLMREEIDRIKNQVSQKFNEKYADIIDEYYYTKILELPVPTQSYLASKYGISQAQISRVINKFEDAFQNALIRSGYTY